MMASTAAPSCQCSTDGRSRRVLIVKKLHPAVTMQSLLGTFGTYGAITGCKVFTHKSGRSAGCASVEFASHQGACTAYNQLQGTQLHGKNICLQWFNHDISSTSPVRPIDQLLDGSSPVTDNDKYAARNNHAPTTSGPSTASLKPPSPFSMLASSPQHSPFAPNGAAVAHHQHQLAALLTGAGHRSQQKMHRQASAPLNSALQRQMSAGAQFQLPPLSSPGMGNVYDVINFPGAMAGASMPLQAAQDLSALQQLATMQQQQLAALAVQQMTAGSHQMDVQQISPLSPARPQQQQQQEHALAALQSQQQQVQAQLLQQHQQVGSPAPSHSHAMLQLARSMPVDLSNSLGSLCGSSGSILQSGSMLLQQHARRSDAAGLAFETPGSAGSPLHTSPFAINHSDKYIGSDAASEWSSSSTSLTTAQQDASTEENMVADTVPASARSLKASKTASYDKKKPVDGSGAVDAWEPGMSLLPCAAGSWPPPTTFEVAVRATMLLNGADDTASFARDAGVPAANAAGPEAFALPGVASSQGPHLVDAASPELLAALQLYPSEHLPSSSNLMHASNEQIAAAAAAAAVAFEQQQHLLAAAFGAQQVQLPPMYGTQQNPNVRFSDLGGSCSGLAAKLSSMRIKAPRASDSQVLLGAREQRNGLHRSSPMLPGSTVPPVQPPGTAASSASHSWQRGVTALTGQQLQGPSSPGPVLVGVPAAEAFRSKHKQQLQLAVPEVEYISAPMTCTAVPGGWEHTLIGTDVLPESPAASALQCHVDYHAAVLSAAGSAAGSTAMPVAMSSTWGNTDWSSGSALSALLSPAHVSTLAGRRCTDLGAPSAAGSSQFSSAAAGWAPAESRDRSLSCGLGTVSEELALSAAAREWGIGSEAKFGGITRHSSLCLDMPRQQQQLSGSFDSEAAAGGPSGTAREISLSSSSNRPGSRMSEGSMAMNGLKRAGISEPGNGLYSSGSFTFSPHVLQHKQSDSSNDPGSTADDAIISQPFQMPAFFRPSASNQEMAYCPEMGAAAAAAVPGTSAPLNDPSRGIAIQQLQHSHSMPAEVGPTGHADNPAPHQQQGQQKADPAGYSAVFRSLWGSGAGDAP